MFTKRSQICLKRTRLGLNNSMFSEEDQKQLQLLAASLDSPPLLLSFDYQREIDMRSIARAITMLLTIRDAPYATPDVEYGPIAPS